MSANKITAILLDNEDNSNIKELFEIINILFDNPNNLQDHDIRKDIMEIFFNKIGMLLSSHSIEEQFEIFYFLEKSNLQNKDKLLKIFFAQLDISLKKDITSLQYYLSPIKKIIEDSSVEGTIWSIEFIKVIGKILSAFTDRLNLLTEKQQEVIYQILNEINILGDQDYYNVESNQIY